MSGYHSDLKKQSISSGWFMNEWLTYIIFAISWPPSSGFGSTPIQKIDASSGGLYGGDSSV